MSPPSSSATDRLETIREQYSQFQDCQVLLTPNNPTKKRTRERNNDHTTNTCLNLLVQNDPQAQTHVPAFAHIVPNKDEPKAELQRFLRNYRTIIIDPSVPGPLDILAGRGKPTQEHTGNALFQIAVIQYFRKQYIQAPARWQKRNLARNIVWAVRATHIVRFLKRKKQSNNEWTELTEEEAILKVSHGLRKRGAHSGKFVDLPRSLLAAVSDESPADLEVDNGPFEVEISHAASPISSQPSSFRLPAKYVKLTTLVREAQLSFQMDNDRRQQLATMVACRTQLPLQAVVATGLDTSLFRGRVAAALPAEVAASPSGAGIIAESHHLTTKRPRSNPQRQPVVLCAAPSKGPIASAGNTLPLPELHTIFPHPQQDPLSSANSCFGVPPLVRCASQPFCATPQLPLQYSHLAHVGFHSTATSSSIVGQRFSPLFSPTGEGTMAPNNPPSYPDDARSSQMTQQRSIASDRQERYTPRMVQSQEMQCHADEEEDLDDGDSSSSVSVSSADSASASSSSLSSSNLVIISS